MVDIKNIRASICKIGKLLYERDLTDSSGGNISVRDGNLIYINPRRAGHDFQWELEEDQIIVTDLCKVPIIGEVDMISREAATHYYIYQNFPDVCSVIHGHPFYMMAFGAAHMDIPAVSEGTRAVIGTQPITNIPEVVPGSIEQAEEIVKNFNKRREIDPGCPLICNIPFHGAFAAGNNINDAFLFTEVANNCAKILIYRQMMFGNDPKADFSIHKHFTKEDFKTIEVSKDVCTPGYFYTDAFGRQAVYSAGGSSQAVPDSKGVSAVPVIQQEQYREIIRRVTEAVVNQLKK
ncbi:MAG: L-ribulose-5-phosphate 4-epimerase SgbE [Actinobacteria bacterium ADurb.Bin346]|nr:MAG: L-ribulose-5-phosphate 4-epimerase SgbE [Actinobacteria bacterium ADurb.Bin346]